MRSLRSRLLLLWAVSLLAALAVAGPLIMLYRAQGRAQAGRDELEVARACDAIAESYTYYVAGWSGPDAGAADPDFRAGLAAVRDAALRGSGEPRGGIWQRETGLLVDEPLASLPQVHEAIVATASEAVAEDRPASQRTVADGTAIALRACPLHGPVSDLAAYVITRAEAAPGLPQARIGLAVLATLVLATSIGVGVVLVGYSRRIAAIEAALAAGGPDLPRLPTTGERDLDRIVAAFNRAADSLAEARTRETELARRVTAAERLASIGRVAAGVAHEIRNPIAAMRLRAENALAGDTARRDAALAAILVQIARIDHLVADLLDMTRPRAAEPAPVDLRATLAAIAPDGTHLDCPDTTLALDAGLLARILGNLLSNATRAGGPVNLLATLTPGTLTITVIDSGPGVPPALRDTLFEPFVTGHAEGTGLGLAIAREAANALGGGLELTDPGGAGQGATFTLTLPVPWPVS